jgi:thiamine biosynthesis protein ThiS
MIKLRLNGDDVEVESPITLASLLMQRSLDQGRFVAVVNDEVIPKSQLENAQLNENDVVDIMTPITGG